MAKYRVTGPDGQAYDVTAPDGATEREVREFAQSKLGSGFGGHLNRAVANFIGAPLQVAHDVNRVLGISDEADYRASEAVAEGMRAIGDPVAGPDERPTTFGGRLGRVVGEAGTMALPVAGAASMLAKGTTVAAPVAQQLIRELAQHPLRSAALEAAGVTGAAAGGHVAQEMSGGKSPGMEMAGELAGGVLAPIAATGGVVGTLARKAGQPFTQTGGRGRAAKRLAGVTDDPNAAVDALERETISNLTPAQRVGTDEAYSLERAVTDSSPAIRKSMQERNVTNQQLLEAEARKLGGGGNFSDTQGYLQKRAGTLVDRMKQRAAQAEQAATGKLGQLTPGRSSTQAQLDVRGEIEQAYGTARATERELWAKVPNLPILPQGTKATFAEMVRNTPRAQVDDIPAVAAQLLGKGGGKGLGSVKELQGLRSKLLEESRLARASGNYNRARLADELADATLADLGATAQNASGTVGQPLREALDFSRQVNSTYRQGNLGKILGSDRTGADRLPEELTLQGTVGRGGERGAVALDEILQAAPTREARGATEDYLRNQMRGLFTPDGQLSATKAQTWMRNNEEILNRNPQLRQQLTEALDAQGVAAGRRERAGAIETSLTRSQKSATAQMLNAPVGDEVTAILRARNPEAAARQAVQLVRRSPEAVAGLRSGTIEHLLNASRSGTIEESGHLAVSGNKLLKELMNPRQRAALDAMLGKESTGRLDRIARELMRIEGSAKAAAGGKIVDDTPNKLLSILVRGKAAQLGGQMGGGTAGGSLQTANIASGEARNWLRRLAADKAERLLVLAAEDNDLYKALMSDMGTLKGQQQAARHLNLWFYSTGAQANYPELFEEGE